MKQKWLYILLAIVIVFCSIGIISVNSLSKIGSRGDEVRQIQTKLKNWGYYSGSVDGIFGTQTEKAVRYFQQKNNLTVDGIAGKKTLEKMGIFSSSNSNTNSANYELLARLISAEARGEPYNGQVAVGAVVLNRVAHPSFPNTVSGVIYQKGSFTCLTDGQFEKPVADSAYRAARDALNGVKPCGGAIYYYNPKTATSTWIRSRPLIITIGNHKFCK